MFNFLKRKKYKLPESSKIEEKDILFLKSLVSILPSDYSFLKQQVNYDFIVSKRPMILQQEGNISFALDEKLFNKFKKKSFPESSEINNIKVKNKKTKLMNIISIHLLNGTIWGYYLDPSTSFSDLNFEEFDTSNIEFKQYNNDDKLKLEEIILLEKQSPIRKFLDIENTFKIEIDEGNFYVIKDLGDGNYLGIDKDGAVYGLIHDPYQKGLH
ncbi:hypothetical protein [Aquimarina macrocephali]|uniref:hypothetical protein n=1 Tax=Aquimarina macrocephali TaxID=666563 RepID=UPI0012696841|nr:hypothetical protein [Aquimarina macrocephali]